VRSRPESFVGNLHLLRELVQEYLATPWLHNRHLDWLMLDALTAGHIIGAVEVYMTQKHGLAYARFGAVRWKLLLWKMVLWTVMLAADWGLPAIVCFFVAYYSAVAAVGLGIIWYGWNLVVIAIKLWHRLTRLVSGKRPTPLALIEEMESVYTLLRGPAVHVPTVRAAFDRAAAKGAVWDQVGLCVLDHLAADPSPVWISNE
jgi:hypothetical protein